MTTQQQLKKKGLAISLLAASLMLSVACAKKSDGGGSSTPDGTTTSPTTPGTPTVRDVDGPRGAGFAAGATAALQIDSMAALTSYVATHPVNNPQDIRISVKLHDAGTNQYAGDIYISYYDNGQYYTGHFVTDDGQNPTGNTASSGTIYPGAKHAAYNNWFTWNGAAAFHGFYQDSYGAIMLIVDQAIDQGDGSGASEVSGSIWFKNFANSQAMANPQSIPCWFITQGPYDCRTFLVNNGKDYGNINQTTALYPTQSQWYTSRSTHPYIPEEPARGWRRLGTFSGLNKGKAFTQ